MNKLARIAAEASQPMPTVADAVADDEADRMAASASRIERRLRMLDDLAEMAMKLASRVAERALAEEPAATDTAQTPPASLYVADDFAKLSRAVRLTLDLAGRLEEALRAVRAGEAQVRETYRQTRAANDNRARSERREARGSQVREQMTLAIVRETESETEADELLDALEERLSDDIAYVHVGDTPLRETVERLCRDLGLSPDWSDWTEEGWPVTPTNGFPPRDPWSPFNRVSRKPVLT